jgi:hypothetical protein
MSDDCGRSTQAGPPDHSLRVCCPSNPDFRVLRFVPEGRTTAGSGSAWRRIRQPTICAVRACLQLEYPAGVGLEDAAFQLSG